MLAVLRNAWAAASTESWQARHGAEIDPVGVQYQLGVAVGSSAAASGRV